MNSNPNYWQFLAGTAVFVYAMGLIEDSLKKIAGRPFKKFLQKQTTHHARAITAGAIVTAFLQSSSIVIAMVLSFVGAGIMNIRSALAVMVGANLGTTLDTWVVAILGFKLDLESLSFPILSIALICILFFSNHHQLKNIGSFLVGFAMIFIGLEWMKTSMGHLVNLIDYQAWNGVNVYLFIPLGILMTMLIQSSTTVMAIMLVALQQGLMSFDRCVAIGIGSELGTTLKFLLGSVTGSVDKKRLALGNVVYNIASVIMGTIMLYPLLAIIDEILKIHDPVIGLVAFMSILNFLGILLIYPYLTPFSNWLQKRYIHEPNAEISSWKDGNSLDYQVAYHNKELLRLISIIIAYNKALLGIHPYPVEAISIYKKIKNWISPQPSKEEYYKTIKSIQGQFWQNLLEFQMDIEVRDVGHLQNILGALRVNNAVESVDRVREADASASHEGPLP